MVLNQMLNLYAKYGFKPMLRFTLVLNYSLKLLPYHSICYHGNILLISLVVFYSTFSRIEK